jgi:hypothetical protein
VKSSLYEDSVYVPFPVFLLALRSITTMFKRLLIFYDWYFGLVLSFSEYYTTPPLIEYNTELYYVMFSYIFVKKGNIVRVS